MDENGDIADERDPGSEHSGAPSADEIVFPPVDEIIANNGAFHLLDEEAKHPETKPTDPSTPPLGGDATLNWTALRCVNDVWAKIAMETYGRVGRDPSRIEPFLRFFEVIWERQSHLTFGRVVWEAMSFRNPPLQLFAPEEDSFVQCLREWDDAIEALQGEAASPIDEGRSDRGSGRIRPFLDRSREAWELDPDQRFGQLVSNVIRLRQPLDSLESIADDDYLLLIDKWISERRHP